MDNEKLKDKELNDEQLTKVSGGTNEACDNPKGFKEGDRVYVYYDLIDEWLWATYLYYYDGKYRVKWNDTQLIHKGGISLFVEADETSVTEQYIK